jgi:hypothetical protein
MLPRARKPVLWRQSQQLVVFVYRLAGGGRSSRTIYVFQIGVLQHQRLPLLRGACGEMRQLRGGRLARDCVFVAAAFCPQNPHVDQTTALDHAPLLIWCKGRKNLRSPARYFAR